MNRASKVQGRELFQLGFGTAPLGNLYRSVPEDAATNAMQCAWESGLRYFDTAPLYGHGLAEARLGRFLKNHARSEYQISTKVGRRLEPCPRGEENSGPYVDTPPFKAVFDYSRDGVLRSFETSLERLGLDHVDILYVHDLEAVVHGADGVERRWRELTEQGGWKALSELRSSGLVGAIGLGVNTVEPCERLLDTADPDVLLVAGRYTLLDQSAGDHLFPRCLDRGVAIVVGGPFNSGILATGARQDARYNYSPAPPEVLARTMELDKICRRYGVPLPQAALQFSIAHPAVASVIPGGRTPKEISLNAAMFSAGTPPELWAELKALRLIAANVPTPGDQASC